MEIKKLKVPFVKSEEKWKGRGWCGLLALASILRYYDDETPVEEIAKHVKISKVGGAVLQGLINFCLSKGFKVSFFAEDEYETEDNERYSDEMKGFLKKIGAEEREKYFHDLNKENGNYSFVDRKAKLNDIRSYLDMGVPVLMIHNVAVVFGKDKFWSHYIAVVGYDEENFYIHNIATGNFEFQKVPKEVLEKSWECGGIDHVMIVVEK